MTDDEHRKSLRNMPTGEFAMIPLSQVTVTKSVDEVSDYDTLYGLEMLWICGLAEQSDVVVDSDVQYLESHRATMNKIPFDAWSTK